MGWHSHADYRAELSPRPVSAVSWAANRVDVFGVSTRNTLQQWWGNGTGLQGPHDHGGRLRGNTPSAVAWGPDRLDIFAIGADDNDGRVVHYWWNGQAWGKRHAMAGERGLLANSG